MTNIVIAICIGYYIGYICASKVATDAMKALIYDVFDSFIELVKPTKEVMDNFYDAIEEKGFEYSENRSKIFDNVHTVIMIILGICLGIKLIEIWT